jgi:hypothetical protein
MRKIFTTCGPEHRRIILAFFASEFARGNDTSEPSKEIPQLSTGATPPLPTCSGSQG